ncbi:N-acetylglucosamine-1-phosphotransferase subunits alpha/beta-like [Liolophura sinensis]|uniref:N-acetylglucosamine-1-phosphotransferase subunits alpha/beta-like n=1 Tax=Liolophura sinensis TaxID=3198878 RepID=UPI0031580E8A
MQPSLQKLLQKRIYDVLSHKYGLCLIVAGLFFCIGSLFMFGEALMEWSRDKYAAVFNSFSENIAGRSFQNRLCLPVPIDVVYTWVNGSDPELLMNLKRYKLELEKELNVSKSGPGKKKNEGKCTFSQCVQVRSVVLDPELRGTYTVDTLRSTADAFREAVEMFKVSYPIDNKLNYTVVTFGTDQQVMKVANLSYIVIDGQNHTINKAYITSDWTVEHSVLLHDTIIMSGFPHKYTPQRLKDSIPEKYRKGISKIDLHEDKGLAVLYVPVRADFDALLELTNLTLEGKSPTMNAANLIWDMSESIHGDVASASRFEDNEELRYSIRSLERFAPWIRHVYIVTNGQIPSWLNMDHPRVTIVTHQEIFVNQSHLPSFSSPAIESHIHRIPGLSDKFIYLNDDVMFGKEVWPDDFYTHSRGQKVYLSWPVPNCQEGCPSNWIRDGYCDKACNNSQCDWDGGDCEGSKTGGGQGGGNGGFYFNNNKQDSSKLYCASGCANNWIADKYCDQSCNVQNCGFDAADCGTENFHQLYGIQFEADKKEYFIPQGEFVFFLNLSSLLVDDAVITQASYNQSEALRTAAVAIKFKVMTVVLHENHNKTRLSFHLKGNRGDETSMFEYNFTMVVDPKVIPKADKNDTHVAAKEGKKETVADNSTEIVKAINVTDQPVFVFEDIPQRERAPHMKLDKVHVDVPDRNIKSVNLSALELPEDLKAEWEEAKAQFDEGDITEKGFNQLKSSIWQKLNSQKQARASDAAFDEQVLKNNLFHGEQQRGKEQVHEVKETKIGKEQVQKDVSHLAKEQVQTGKDSQLGKEAVQDGKESRLSKDPVQDGKESQLGKEPVQDGKESQLGKDPVQDGKESRLGKDPVQDGKKSQLGKEPVQDGKESRLGKDPVQDGKESEVGKEQEKGEEKLYDRDERVHGSHRSLLSIIQSNRPEGWTSDLFPNYGQPFHSASSNTSNKGDNLPPGVALENLFKPGGFKWERSGMFVELQKKKAELMQQQEYTSNGRTSGRSLSQFADSLRHVNKIYNKVFGYSARKVPSHMPHMIDKHIMTELHKRFPEEWDVTSAHRVRSSTDMQFAFSYFYYLMGVTRNVTAAEIFDMMDTDKSRVLSDREIRTLATRLYSLPLDLQTLTGLENVMMNCSKYLPEQLTKEVPEPPKESYYVADMPQVTRNLFINCEEIKELLAKNFKPQPLYQYEVVGDDSEVAFKMIKTNVSSVVGQLDDIRKNPKKFICLNDNIDHESEEAKTVKAVLVDFYESMFPIPSQFELPPDYRNRFLSMNELREWKKYRDWLKFWTNIALVLLVLFAIISFFGDKIEAVQRQYSRRRQPRPADTPGDSDNPSPSSKDTVLDV